MDARARSHIDAASKRLLDHLAGLVAQDARDNAPRLTGRLADGIKADPATADKVRISAHTEDAPSGPYSVYVELGTSKQAAQPFLAPAAYRHRGP